MYMYVHMCVYMCVHACLLVMILCPACKGATLDIGDTAHYASDWSQPVGPFGPSLEREWFVCLLSFLIHFLVCVCLGLGWHQHLNEETLKDAYLLHWSGKRK